MIVFLAGMPRSGSTFSFNVVRGLLEHRAAVRQEATTDILSLVERAVAVDHVLLKAHTANAVMLRLVELGAIKVVCTVRRPEDAIASLIDTFQVSLDELISQMRDWITMFYQLRRHALVIPYAELDRQPWRAAWRIGKKICPDAGMGEIIRVAQANSKENVKAACDHLARNGEGVRDIGFSYYNTKTFYHRRHVSTINSQAAAIRIGQDAVATIRKELRNYLDAEGDLLGAEPSSSAASCVDACKSFFVRSTGRLMGWPAPHSHVTG